MTVSLLKADPSGHAIGIGMPTISSLFLSAGHYGKKCNEDEKWNYRVVPTTR